MKANERLATSMPRLLASSDGFEFIKAPFVIRRWRSFAGLCLPSFVGPS